MSDHYYRRRPVWDDPSYERFEAPPMTDEQRQSFLDLAQWITEDVARQRREDAEAAARAAPSTITLRVPQWLHRILRGRT